MRIKTAANHSARNGPLGVSITTGTRYFAAVLAQEIYEAQRYMLWFWLPAIALGAAAWQFNFYIGFASFAWIMAVGRGIAPLKRTLEKRELFGQAIEISAIRLLYGRSDMVSEYRLQARSLIRSDSPYIERGMFRDMSIDPLEYTNSDILKGEIHPSVEAMVFELKKLESAASDWVHSNRSWISDAMPMGEGDKGY